MLDKNYLIGLDEELVLLSKYCKIKLSGIIDLNKNGTWNKLNIYPEKEELIRELNVTNIIIGIDNPFIKKRLDNWYRKFNVNLISLISNKIDDTSKYGDGLITQKKSFVSINCNFGRCVKINVGAVIMHDVVLGDYVTVAPAAVLLGRVKVGNNVFIGANSTILPDVKIGNDCVIGAGAVVTKDVPEKSIAKGVPAIFKDKIFNDKN